MVNGTQLQPQPQEKSLHNDDTSNTKLPPTVQRLEQQSLVVGNFPLVCDTDDNNNNNYNNSNNIIGRSGNDEDDDNSSTTSSDYDSSNSNEDDNADDILYNNKKKKGNSKHKKRSSPNGNASGTEVDKKTRGGGSGLATDETKAVQRIKHCFVLFLVACMAIVGWGVYEYIQNQEQQTFEFQFEEDAKKVLATLGSNMERILEGMDAFSVSLVSYARATNQTWPFVVVPDFAVRAEKIRSLSHAVLLNTYPFVNVDERTEWEQFTSQNKYWVDETIAIMEANPKNVWPIVHNYTTWDVIYAIDELWKEEPGKYGTDQPGPWLPIWQIMPVIPLTSSPYNWNLLSQVDPSSAYAVLNTHKAIIKEAYNFNTEDMDDARIQQNIASANWYKNFLTTDEEPLEPVSDYYYPIIDNSIDQINLYDEDNYDVETNKVVSIMALSIYWRDALKNILSENAKGIVVVFENECNPPFTYQIDGANVQFLGGGDRHSDKYDDLVQSSWLSQLRQFSSSSSSSQRSYSGRPLNEDYCPHYISVYPSDTNKALYTSNNPVVFASIAMAIFLFTSLGFILYDCYVERRHRLIHRTAVQSKTIVESLFPAFVREGLEEDAMPAVETPKKRLVTFLNDSSATPSGGGSHDSINRGSSNNKYIQSLPYFGGDSTVNPLHNNTTTIGSTKGKPIAELFPHTTVMFADISGFTAWASVRDPSQVFALLESVYGAFDRIAGRRKVFKVETIGDCYVAVCGLPQPNECHALVMCKFAHDCREKMKIVTRELETTLGPGTGDLTLRIGLHSGPTTAGVLRGQKARFQLFGDTVNTASRMESTGIPNLIQVSQKTADLLVEFGKAHWLRARSDLVSAKGKGVLQTYFVEPRTKTTASVVSSAMHSTCSMTASSDDADYSSGDLVIGSDTFLRPINEDQQDDVRKNSSSKLVEWNTQLFEGLLQDILKFRKKEAEGEANNKKKMSRAQLSRRKEPVKNKSAQKNGTDDISHLEQVYDIEKKINKGQDDRRVRDEVAEVIIMAEFNPNTIQGAIEEDVAGDDSSSSSSLLTTEVRYQLRNYIEMIASFYPNNPFHNFEHASHVMMSVVKLLQRIATREVENSRGEEVLTKRSYYDYTYGIAADPLTKFAVAFSALIHDVDHQGVSNGQLAKESSSLARFYNNKSIAEQNSIDVAWSLLMEDSYKDLRAAIYTTPDELKRFRQLVVNCVIATDIFDKELKTLRDGRWEKAFESSPSSPSIGSAKDDDRNDFSKRHRNSSSNLFKLLDVSMDASSSNNSTSNSGSNKGAGDEEDNDANNSCWNRKATIVIEHIIQASDVAHTMQHWHVYQKWNAQLFNECYAAYKTGRAEKDPSEGWYEGELWFFDNYIIPLAKKLKECEVFGVSCDEFLDFANENRKEWAVKGRDIVIQMKARNEKKWKRKSFQINNDDE